MNTKRSAIIVLAVAAVGLLAGCGGGTSPAADTPKSQAYKYGGFEWNIIDPAGYLGSMFLGTELNSPSDAQRNRSPRQLCDNNAQYMQDTYGDSDYAGFGTLDTPAKVADFRVGCEDAAMATGNYASVDSGPLTLPSTPAANLTTAPAPVTTTAAAPPAVTVTEPAPPPVTVTSAGSNWEVDGWYGPGGVWYSPGSAARALAAGISPGEDVPNYLRCGVICGEIPTSGDDQSGNIPPGYTPLHGSEGAYSEDNTQTTTEEYHGEDFEGTDPPVPSTTDAPVVGDPCTVSGARDSNGDFVHDANTGYVMVCRTSPNDPQLRWGLQ